MKNICEWKNCKEFGTYKAPAEKDNSKNFKLLCKEHIKMFNKNWDYFDGMSQEEIKIFLKSDLTWHKPTQKFASSDNFFNILWNNALSDKFKIFEKNGKNNKYKDRELCEKDMLIQTIENFPKEIGMLLEFWALNPIPTGRLYKKNLKHL